MHFAELAIRIASYTEWALESARKDVSRELEHTGGATTAVRNLQMLQLQNAVVSVGMFAMFEASLQDELNCTDGFREAAAILDRDGRHDLRERLDNQCLAINVLKHGRGRSYDALVAKAPTLPFRLKMPGEASFFEGDVAEAQTLIEVDEAFIMACADLILEVAGAMPAPSRRPD